MRPVLLDTNLLVLALINEVAPSLIGRHRRVRAYSARHVRELDLLLARFGRNLTLPNILTEASNLIGSGDQEIAPRMNQAFASIVERADEVFVPSSHVITEPAFGRLGLTDAAIIQLVNADTTVITDDYALAGMLARRGLAAINLLHRLTP